MACFLVTVAEAIVTTAAAKIVEKKEKKGKTVRVDLGGSSPEEVTKIPFSRKLKWLNRLLWGGSALLAFEHIWHGEVVPFFPFLTAASDPEQTAEMLHEMATAGVTMALAVTAVWLVMVGVSAVIEKRSLKQAEKAAGAEN